MVSSATETNRAGYFSNTSTVLALSLLKKIWVVASDEPVDAMPNSAPALPLLTFL